MEEWTEKSPLLLLERSNEEEPAPRTQRWPNCAREPMIARARVTALVVVVAAAVVMVSLTTTSKYQSLRHDHDSAASRIVHRLPPIPHHSNHHHVQSSSSSSIWFSAQPAPVQVRRGRAAFPSFWDAYDYAVQHNTCIVVSYDQRSIRIPHATSSTHDSYYGHNVLMLGGSMHPVRATRMTWEWALDEAVHNGLNLVTIYVFWSAHQPYANEPYQWSLVHPLLQKTTTRQPEEASFLFQDWELADAITSCARRGLFVHIRIGPYVCAEYSYGGIPEWLPLQHDSDHQHKMRMRRLDPAWMQAMEWYVSNVTAYLSQHALWATQRGPIIMAQIENELGDDDDDEATSSSSTGFMQDDLTSSSMSRAKILSPMQEYANWCGSMAAKYIPAGVVLTMCNGLSANNTINTHNGDSQLVGWLERHGDNGRIQLDQPALWTEDEGGFQLWGEESGHAVDYFWGHTARYMTKRALQWFARGGSHLNYYMWWGGYNRARMAAAGIMNAYATDTVLCSSGERHQPKFDHFQAMHTALADVAEVLTASTTALFHNKSVDVLSGGTWVPGNYQTMFAYCLSERHQIQEVLFVENNIDVGCTVRVNVRALKEPFVFDMSPDSGVMIVDGVVRFDSGSINPRADAYVRKEQSQPVQLFNWSYWGEPTEEASDLASRSSHPIEQTALAVSLHSSSDYAWYLASFDLQDELETSTWCIQTQKANGMIVFVDGTYIGSAENHEHDEGDDSLSITSQRRLLRGNHTLSILSVSLGYHNLIGRWSANVGQKLKGITGQVSLSSPQLYDGTLNLVDGRLWISDSGLKTGETQRVERRSNYHLAGLPLWSSARFLTPSYIAGKVQLFVRIASGRGHLYLNGFDLGRFWNIDRGASSAPSMTSYFLPPDFLFAGNMTNTLVFFNEFGQFTEPPTLFLSWLEPVENVGDPLHDEVDFYRACSLY